MIDNPFPLNKYTTPDLFCDRDYETNYLRDNLTNGRNTLLVSPRRFGKTALIKHALSAYQKSRKTTTIYVDIFSATNLNDFNQLLLNAVTEAISSTPKAFLTNVGKYFSKLRPTVTYNELTGVPSVGIGYSDAQHQETTLAQIFQVLSSFNKHFFIAIDEFQQIEYFPEKNTDAILRTYIQQSGNTTFIFSGSEKHTLMSIFNGAKRPFFSSVSTLQLEKIPKDIYAEFILHQFKRNKRNIEKTEVDRALDWCQCHTFYVQSFFNRLYGKNLTSYSTNDFTQVMIELVKEQDAQMTPLQKTLSKVQWNVLKAISLEESLTSPSSKGIMKKYNLSTSASVLKALNALLNMELVYISGHLEENQKPIYSPYNVFIGKWFRHRSSV